MKKTIAVIFGGRSGEHEISIRSARTVIENIDSDKYDVVPIAIMNDGRWLLPAESVRQFPDHTQKVFREGFGEPRTDGGGLLSVAGRIHGDEALTHVGATDTERATDMERAA